MTKSKCAKAGSALPVWALPAPNPGAQAFQHDHRRGDGSLGGAAWAGKSTISNRLLFRFYDLTGAVEIDGIDIRSVSLNSVACHCRRAPGLVFLNDSPANIRYGRPTATDDHAGHWGRHSEDVTSGYPTG